MSTQNGPMTTSYLSKSSFTKKSKIFENLRTLQSLIKKEAMRKELVLEVKETFFSKMEQDIHKIIQNKVKIAEKFDKSNQLINTVTYNLAKNSHDIYKDETMYISKVMLFLRRYQDFLYKILIDCKNDHEKICISNLVANFFYINVLSSTSIDDEYLFILYRLLKYEINSLTKTNAPEKFLDNSITSYLFKYLISNDDIKVYFGKILNEIIEKIDNKEDYQEITFDPGTITEREKERKESKKGKKQGEEMTEELLQTIFSIKDQNKSENSFGSFDGIEDSNEKLHKETEQFLIKYIPDLTRKELQNLLYKYENDPQMTDYIIKQLNEYKTTSNDSLFSNSAFMEEVYKSPYARQVIGTYQSYFSVVIDVIIRLLDNFNQNLSIIPDSLRYLSKIIEILIRKKFPNIMNSELNAFIAEFFFKKIMKPILTETDYNGLLTSKLLNHETKNNIKIVEQIISQLVSGMFFKSTDNSKYVTFNRFFLEIMPKVMEFFGHLLDVQLPPFIQKILEEEEKLPENNNSFCENYIYEYFKEKPSETLQYVTVCFSPEQFLTIFEIIHRNESNFIKTDFDERMKSDYGFFKASYNKFKDKDHMMFVKKAKDQDDNSKPKTLTFVVENELYFSEQFKKMLNVKQGYFTVKEIETPKNDEERNANVLIKIKNALSEILYNIHDIPETNFFGTTITNIQEFVDTLLQIIKINYYTIDNPVYTEWYIFSLKTLLPKLPPDYQYNDYDKLFKELQNEVNDSINIIDMDLFTKIKNQKRYAIKELKKSINNLDNFKNVEFNRKVQNFLDEAIIEISMSMQKVSKKKKLVIESTNTTSANRFKYLDNFLFEKKIEKSNVILTIERFIKKFPNFAGHNKNDKNEEEIFERQKKLEVPQALICYYDIIKKAIFNYLMEKEKQKKCNQDDNNNNHKKKDKDKSKKEKEKEIDKIKGEELKKQIELETEKVFKEVSYYIMTKIYDKLFPVESDSYDLKIYQQCVMLSWIVPHHIGKIQKINSENFLPDSVGYIKKLDDIKNPYQKMEIFSKVSEMILNTLNFCVGKVEGGVDDTLPLLLFVIIKAQPKRFSSNMNYIELYYHNLGHGPDSQRFAILTAIKERLLNFTYKDLLNVTEQEFLENSSRM